MAVGLVPVCSGINIPWTTPAIISGFLAINWVGALLQALLLVMGVFIYMPFIKAMDDEYLKEEKENVSKMDEADEADAIDLDNLSFDDL